jgi:hypothetical protein
MSKDQEEWGQHMEGQMGVDTCYDDFISSVNPTRDPPWKTHQATTRTRLFGQSTVAILAI